MIEQWSNEFGCMLCTLLCSQCVPGWRAAIQQWEEAPTHCHPELPAQAFLLLISLLGHGMGVVAPELGHEPLLLAAAHCREALWSAEQSLHRSSMHIRL